MLQGIIFALLSPALYSVVNYTDKFLLDKHRLHPNVIAIYSGIFAFLSSLIVFLFVGFHDIGFKTAGLIVISGFLTEMVLLPYFKALSLEETSRVVPLFQPVPVIVILVSRFLLSEHLSLMQLVGCGLVIIGGYILSIKKLDAKVFMPRVAFWYMLLASIYAALSILFFKVGVSKTTFWPILPYEGLGIALGAFVIFLFNQQLFIKRTKKLGVATIGIMSINESIYLLSRYTGFYALSFISASLVSTLGGFQPLFILIYGVVLSLWFPRIINEVITKRTIQLKLTAVVILCLGSIFIFLK